MDFLLRVRGLCMNFLFPKEDRVIELESLTSSQILETLPQAERVGEKNVYALFDYAHPVVKEMIWQVKYSGNRVIAEKLGEVLYDVICDELRELSLSGDWSNIALVPVPVSDKRRFERGWNQAEILCEATMKCDVNKTFKYIPRQLAKRVHTESQTKTSSRSERLKNLANTMKVLDPKQFQDKSIVLVDDVTTTCATFREAMRALRDAGAKKILCIAVAH